MDKSKEKFNERMEDNSKYFKSNEIDLYGLITDVIYNRLDIFFEEGEWEEYLTNKFSLKHTNDIYLNRFRIEECFGDIFICEYVDKDIKNINSYRIGSSKEVSIKGLEDIVSILNSLFSMNIRYAKAITNATDIVMEKMEHDELYRELIRILSLV